MRKLLYFSLSLFLNLGHAQNHDDLYEHHFYVGGLGGYGSTTWQGLVPSERKQNMAINISTPISASEGGGVYGALLGFEFTPFFALEGQYIHFPTASISFDENSLFAFDHNDRTELSTQTEMVAALAKIMLIVPKTHVRAYSGFGIADIHREDEIKDQWRVTPTFNIGLNYLFTPRVMGEITASYTAGYGESEINPTDDYIPFLYALYAKLAFRFW